MHFDLFPNYIDLMAFKPFAFLVLCTHGIDSMSGNLSSSLRDDTPVQVLGVCVHTHTFHKQAVIHIPGYMTLSLG